MDGAWHVAVIEPETRNGVEPAKRGLKPRRILALPKGAVDPGERPEETAAREIFEETGVQANRITKLADIKYFYQRTWGGRERVFKVVSFYLFVYASGELGEIAPEMRIEVRCAEWLPLDEAPRRLSYKGEREVVRKALQYVRENPDLQPRRAQTARSNNAVAPPRRTRKSER